MQSQQYLHPVCTHRACGGEQPGASIARRFASEPGVKLFPALLVHGASHAPDKGKEEEGLNVVHQSLARLEYNKSNALSAFGRCLTRVPIPSSMS